MAFQPLCKERYLAEGEAVPFALDGRQVFVERGFVRQDAGLGVHGDVFCDRVHVAQLTPARVVAAADVAVPVDEITCSAAHVASGGVSSIALRFSVMWVLVASA